MDRVIANRLLFNIECFYDNTSGVLSISDVALCANVEHCYVCLLTSLSNAFFFLYLRIIRWPQDYFSFIKFCSKVFTRCMWVCNESLRNCQNTGSRSVFNRSYFRSISVTQTLYLNINLAKPNI